MKIPRYRQNITLFISHSNYNNKKHFNITGYIVDIEYIRKYLAERKTPQPEKGKINSIYIEDNDTYLLRSSDNVKDTNSYLIMFIEADEYPAHIAVKIMIDVVLGRNYLTIPQKEYSYDTLTNENKVKTLRLERDDRTNNVYVIELAYEPYNKEIDFAIEK